MGVNAVPDGYHSVTPYLNISGAAEALEFYARAFNARELFRLPMPDGGVGHAEIRIGNSHIMLSDHCEQSPLQSPAALKGSSVAIYVYVDDVDSLFTQAVDAGATELNPVEDQFYGDRSGTLQDPFGHVWILATHMEDLTPEEVTKRAQAMFGEGDA